MLHSYHIVWLLFSALVAGLTLFAAWKSRRIDGGVVSVAVLLFGSFVVAMIVSSVLFSAKL